MRIHHRFWTKNKACVAGVLLISIAKQLHAAGPFDTWLLAETVPAASQRSLNSVAFGNGIFLAVGDAGVILSSPDGNHWALRNSGVVLRLNRVRFAEGKFVAVGARGVIVTSDDGQQWTAHDSGLTDQDKTSWSAQFFDLVHGDGRWVAVGGTGPGVIPGAPWPQSIRVIVTSADGENWVLADRSGMNNWFTSVAHGNGRFLAMEHDSSRGRVFQWTSTNAIGWTRKESIGGEVRALAFGRGTFAVVWPLPTRTTDINLTDGENLPLQNTLNVPTAKLGIERPTSGTIGFENERFLLLGAGYMWTSENATNWVEHRVTASTNQLFGAAYGAGVYVAVGANGTILHTIWSEASLSNPQITDEGFEFTARVPPGERAVVEFTESLKTSDWTALKEVEGGEGGKEERVIDPGPPAPQRFYRTRFP